VQFHHPNSGQFRYLQQADASDILNQHDNTEDSNRWDFDNPPLNFEATAYFRGGGCCNDDGDIGDYAIKIMGGRHSSTNSPEGWFLIISVIEIKCNKLLDKSAPNMIITT
jgi:hypothetical protein